MKREYGIWPQPTETEGINYVVYIPEQGETLPLIVYLHGAGERGKEISHLDRHGIPRLMAEGQEIPAVILCPQCPATCVWDHVVTVLKGLIDATVARYAIAHDRITLTGSSMGGYGTWMMGESYPTLFAGIAPVAGGGMSWRAPNLRTTPIYAVHGEEDTLVPKICSQLMVDAVQAAGGEATLLLLSGRGHNDGIDAAYRETPLIDWLLHCRRTDFTPVKEFCSEYF